MPWSKEKDFREKLSKLSESQQSIQTLSHWVAFHKANAAHAANVWADEAQRAADPHRQLLLVYLANDVMQNSRRKGTPCADAFASQMATVLPAAHAAATPTVGACTMRTYTCRRHNDTHTATKAGEARVERARARALVRARGRDLQLPDRQRPSRDIHRSAPRAVLAQQQPASPRRPQVRAKLERLLSIWEERAVMPAPQAAGTCARPHRVCLFRNHASSQRAREKSRWRRCGLSSAAESLRPLPRRPCRPTASRQLPPRCSQLLDR